MLTAIRTPALVAGVLFSFRTMEIACSADPSVPLALSLARAGHPVEARREALRTLVSDPSNATGRVVDAACRLRLGLADTNVAAGVLARVASDTVAPAVLRDFAADALKAGAPGVDDRRSARAPAAIRGIVGFYRRQVSPAIGARCSLQPSCSEYFMQAGRLHGILAVPMIADRLVREPSVVRAGENPERVKGQWRFPDRVESHVPRPASRGDGHAH